MAKAYKTTYKIYFNERLKEVSYHGKMTHPIYVQITFERKSIIFKSYYFDLFIKPRYALFTDKVYGPPLEDVKRLETELIEFVFEKIKDKFSLEKFKEAYSYYGADLCDETEPGFIDYLDLFFKDEGMPNLATTVKEGAKYRVVYDVVRDMKRALKEDLYHRLVENALYYAPPYLPIFGFTQTIKKWPMIYLSVLEWETETIQEQFYHYFKINHPNEKIEEVNGHIKLWLARLKNKKL